MTAKIKFEAWTYADAIAKEISSGIVSSDEILDIAYGVSKRLFGDDTTRLLFFYEPDWDRLMVDYYLVA